MQFYVIKNEKLLYDAYGVVYPSYIVKISETILFVWNAVNSSKKTFQNQFFSTHRALLPEF